MCGIPKEWQRLSSVCLKHGNYSPVFRPFHLLYLYFSLMFLLTTASGMQGHRLLLPVVSLEGDGNGEYSSEAKGNADIVNPWQGLETFTVVQVWLLFSKMILDKLKSESQLEYPLGRCHREN